jgi:hypothetical protein
VSEKTEHAKKELKLKGEITYMTKMLNDQTQRHQVELDIQKQKSQLDLIEKHQQELKHAKSTATFEVIEPVA